MSGYIAGLVGLVPAIGYGCMTPIATKIGGSTQKKMLGITFACLILGFIIFFIELPNGLDYSSFLGGTFFAMGLLSGVFWYFGVYFELKAVLRAGVSKAMPFSMAGQFLIVTLFSAFFFKEWLISPSQQIPLGMVCLITISLGIYLISLSPNVQYKNAEESFVETKNSNHFLIYILISGSFFLFYFTIPELIDKMCDKDSWLYIGCKNPNDQIRILNGFDKGLLFPQTIGMFAISLVAFFFKAVRNKDESILECFKDKRIYLNLIPGIFQAFGNLGEIFSTILNGNTIAAPLTQLSVVIATLLGVFYMKEKKPNPYYTITFIGLALITIGAIMCGLMDDILKIN